MVSRTLLLTVLFAIAIGFGAASYSLMVGGGGRGGERGGERGGGFLGNFGERGYGGADNDD